MALRSLELWGRAMTESATGTTRRTSPPAGGAGEEGPVSKTEDRLDRATPPDGNGSVADRGARHDGTRARAAARGLRAHGRHEPVRRAEGDRRPRPVQVVDQAGRADRHGAQGAVLQRADLLVPRADHPGVDPEDPPERHHERADPADAAAAQLRRADRRARVGHRQSSATSPGPTSSRSPTPSSSTCATSSTSTSPGCRSPSTTGCSRGS